MNIKPITNEVAAKYSVHGNTLKRAVKDHPKDRIEVEIGDSKQPDFKPQFKVMRWDNECNFSMRAEEHPDATVEFDGEVVKYITPNYEVHQYDKPDASEDGGFEFEWLLPQKPASNVLTATIQTKGLGFYYQPPLTDEDIARGGERPENVVGSYAVYHTTKGGLNDAAGKAYTTGKAFHIYRPKAIDANGSEVWCELNIDTDNGLVSVTVPQSFLDGATYPVKVDPTFGYTTIGSTLTNLVTSSNIFRQGSTFTPSQNGTVTIVTAYLGATASYTDQFFVALNQKDSGGAGTHAQIFLEDESKSVSTTFGWQDFTIASAGSFTGGVSYILNYTGKPNGVNAGRSFFDTAGAPTYYQSTLATSTYNTTAKQDPWVQGASLTRNYSIYATYTLAASDGFSIALV